MSKRLSERILRLKKNMDLKYIIHNMGTLFFLIKNVFYSTSFFEMFLLRTQRDRKTNDFMVATNWTAQHLRRDIGRWYDI